MAEHGYCYFVNGLWVCSCGCGAIWTNREFRAGGAGELETLSLTDEWLMEGAGDDGP